MPKSKRQQKGASKFSSVNPRERGLQLFNNGRFNEAITLWAPLASDERIRSALAEAYFRRSLTQLDASAIADLQQALVLAPNELRYSFHLGRMLHLQGDLKAAEQYYRAVLARDPKREAALKLLIMLKLSQNPQADLHELPGMSETMQRWIAPVQQLLGGQQPAPGTTAVERFWQGMGLIAQGDAAALDLLRDETALPNPTLNMLRRYYLGVAFGLHKRWDEALPLWQHDASTQTVHAPHGLHQNLAALLFTQIQHALEQGDSTAAAALAHQWRHISAAAAFDELRVTALDQGAQQAARANNWALAIQDWEAAREIVGRGKSSPRPLFHNLALAYEQLEDWMKAADSWRALLRTRSRQQSADQQEQSRWAWVRTRVIECYQRANRPDEAVTVFRQAIKADPNDLDLRIQLSDALLANQQERSAQNELDRILAIDPQHPEALLRKASSLIPLWRHDQAIEMLRRVVKHHSQRADVLRSASMLYMTLGRSYAEFGRYQAAYEMFIEGEPLDPQNFLFPLNQARMLQALPKPNNHDQLVERATQLVGNNTDGWSKILETWALAKQLPQAQAMLERFEREQRPAAEDWMHMGTVLFQRVVPPPQPPANPLSMLGLFGDIRGQSAAKETAPPPETPWTRMVLDIFERVASLKPDNHQFLMAIAALLMLPFSAEAARYAEMAARLQPDDVNTLITLGMIQGLAERVPEAKDTLLKASQLAKRQKQRELQDQANEMRRLVGTPGLRAMVESQMYAAMMMDDLEADGFDFDDFDDEFFDDLDKFM